MPAKPPPSECPVCGADVPPNARACPACGADERAGWNQDATRYDGLDLPESAFADDEEDSKKQPLKKTVSVFWWIVGVGLIAILAYSVLRRS